MVGKPRPRLTYAPSGMSCATRAASCSRVKRIMRISFRLRLGTAARWRAGPSDSDDTPDNDAGSNDHFRVQPAQRDDLAHLRDGAFRCAGHERAEVARGFAIDQVAPAVAPVGLDQGEVGANRILENIVATVNFARLLAFRKRGAIAGGREERTDTGTRRADAFREVTLRHQLQL